MSKHEERTLKISLRYNQFLESLAHLIHALSENLLVKSINDESIKQKIAFLEKINLPESKKKASIKKKYKN
jgi:hypothetical protein